MVVYDENTVGSLCSAELTGICDTDALRYRKGRKGSKSRDGTGHGRGASRAGTIGRHTARGVRWLACLAVKVCFNLFSNRLSVECGKGERQRCIEWTLAPDAKKDRLRCAAVCTSSRLLCLFRVSVDSPVEGELR